MLDYIISFSWKEAKSFWNINYSYIMKFDLLCLSHTGRNLACHRLPIIEIGQKQFGCQKAVMAVRRRWGGLEHGRPPLLKAMTSSLRKNSWKFCLVGLTCNKRFIYSFYSNWKSPPRLAVSGLTLTLSAMDFYENSQYNHYIFKFGGIRIKASWALAAGWLPTSGQPLKMSTFLCTFFLLAVDWLQRLATFQCCAAGGRPNYGLSAHCMNVSIQNIHLLLVGWYFIQDVTSILSGTLSLLLSFRNNFSIQNCLVTYTNFVTSTIKCRLVEILSAIGVINYLALQLCHIVHNDDCV